MIALTRDASGGDIYASKKQGDSAPFHYSKNTPGESPAGRRGQSPLFLLWCARRNWRQIAGHG